MIITLKNADFSASNIGTLSSWRISRSLGSGATYEGVTSVDKGAAFSATVTLAEGYEIGTAGVTVTMGGTVLSGAHSISGNVITITIAEVTGNVLIKVPTVNTATGEEDEPEGLTTYTISKGQIEPGTWVYYSGTDEASKNKGRVKTKELIAVPANSTITWELPAGMKATVAVLKMDGSTNTTTSYVHRTLWAEESGSVTITEAGYLQFIWAYVDTTKDLTVDAWNGTYTYTV